MLYTFCRSATKFGNAGGLANQNLFPEFRELWSGCPVIPCGDMHQFFTDTLYSGFSTTSPLCLPIFSGFFLFTALPERGLCTSFHYKCPASRGDSLWQQGLLVYRWIGQGRTRPSCFHSSRERVAIIYNRPPVFTARRNARIASAVLATAIPSVRLSVRPSVCPSHAGIVSKRWHVARCSLHCRIAKCV